MRPDLKTLPRLAEIEREVVAQAREWGRQRFQERVQQLANEYREVFPPSAAQTPPPDAAKRTRRNKGHH